MATYEHNTRIEPSPGILFCCAARNLKPSACPSLSRSRSGLSSQGNSRRILQFPFESNVSRVDKLLLGYTQPTKHQKVSLVRQLCFFSFSAVDNPFFLLCKCASVPVFFSHGDRQFSFESTLVGQLDQVCPPASLTAEGEIGPNFARPRFSDRQQLILRRFLPHVFLLYFLLPCRGREGWL